ncbi:hypothetical protein R7892_01665 [Ligilactobacillus murinus]|uniref:hypothetical protein n=1 Tax=Ligilactobacillus murinus TaxID=1622 RepID=UPI00296B1756|nr:hypothetical protein [Ligilactobacillus murinus]WOY89489.1 hypothetical protein R7892_01665 [Ligilactobacillus murinus]
MFVTIVLWSPILILVLAYLLRRFSFKVLIYTDELISGDKVKAFSHILFWGIVSYITLVCHHYQILLFEFSSNDVVALSSMIFALWAIYGIYIGFLQFMAGYDNKENGTYLGYQKMDFLTESNIWYHLANNWEFSWSLALSIVLPLVGHYDKSISDYYQYVWQAIISFLIILLIFLFKFSFKVAKTTILINKKTDIGLENVIKFDIKRRYTKYFKQIAKQRFSRGVIKKYFEQVSKQLSNINRVEDKIRFLGIVFSTTVLSIEKMEKFKEIDIINYKHFVKEKYDFISKINVRDDELISLAIDLFRYDVQVFDYLIKRDRCWIEGIYKYRNAHGLLEYKDILGVKVNKKVRELEISTVNIHIYMFDKLAQMAKNKQAISKIVNLIQDESEKTYLISNYWETSSKDKIIVTNNEATGSILQVSKENFVKIKEINAYFSSDYTNINFKEKNEDIIIFLKSNILEINFVLKDGTICNVRRNEVKDYYDNFEEKIWNTLFEKYKNANDTSEVFLPKLRETEHDVVSYGNKGDSISIVKDYDNKATYSQICFKYLTDNYHYIDSSTPQFSNLLKLMNAMSSPYRGAFTLYQLFYPENMNWDSSVEKYVSILKEVIATSGEEKEKFYNDMITIIASVKHGEHVGTEVFERIFDTSGTELIDDNFFNEFKNISKLRLIVVQSILSGNGYREIKLEDSYAKRELVKQYVIGISKTPNIFSSSVDNINILEEYMSEFFISNIDCLYPNEFGEFSLSSLLLLERVLYWKWWNNDNKNEQEFMIHLIKEKVRGKSFSQRYIFFYDSLLKFFTLKLAEIQKNKYSKVTNDKNFKESFKFYLLNYLKNNNLTIDMYLDEIGKEIEDYENLRIGKVERELIKRAVEKIIFTD